MVHSLKEQTHECVIVGPHIDIHPLRALSSLALSFLGGVAGHYQWPHMLGNLALAS
jgi:hypothetical protein